MADVLVVDGAVSLQRGNPIPTTGLINTGGETGDDEAGDYALIMCSTTRSDGNEMLSPSPGSWTEIDNGDCSGDEVVSCTHGVWGMFTDTSEVEEITCSWTEDQFVFAGGSFRYRNVSTSDPIIAAECDSGFGSEAVAPSIDSEPGAQVIRLATFRFPEGIECEFQVEQFTAASFDACSNVDVVNVSIDGFTIFDQTGGPTGEATLPFVNNINNNANWRACTVALRMTTRAIPTMNEWGLMAAAGFMGIAGALYIRRKKALAN